MSDCKIVKVIEEEYLLKETSKPLVLQPFQKRLLNEAFAEDGKAMRWRTIILSMIKKSGKTELGAAIAYAFLRVYGGQVYSIANDEDQAESRAFLRVVEMLELMRKQRPKTFERTVHPDHYKKIVQGKVIRFADYELRNPGPHTLEYIPCDYRGEAGGMPALTVWDELWGVDSDSGARLWTEMQPIPTLPVSMRLVTTYAGFYGESELLYSIYEACVKPDPHTSEPTGERVMDDLPVYRNGSYLCYWDHEPRMPWHTPEFMEEARRDPSLNGREQEYRRIWRNEWVTGLDAFIPIKAVDDAMEAGIGHGYINHFAA